MTFDITRRTHALQTRLAICAGSIIMHYLVPVSVVERLGGSGSLEDIKCLLRGTLFSESNAGRGRADGAVLSSGGQMGRGRGSCYSMFVDDLGSCRGQSRLDSRRCSDKNPDSNFGITATAWTEALREGFSGKEPRERPVSQAPSYGWPGCMTKCAWIAWVYGYLGAYCATEDQPLLIRATVLRTVL